jgi:hypothetical protein
MKVGAIGSTSVANNFYFKSLDTFPSIHYLIEFYDQRLFTTIPKNKYTLTHYCCCYLKTPLECDHDKIKTHHNRR